MAADDLTDLIPVPALAPDALGVPALPPAPVVRAPQIVNPKAHALQSSLGLLAALFGGNAGQGLAIGLGQKMQQEQAQQKDATLRAQQEQDRQNQLYEQQRHQFEQVTTQRQKDLEGYVNSIRKQVNSTSVASVEQYDKLMPGFTNMLRGGGYRVDENWLRQAVPYVSPTEPQQASKLLDSIIKNPLTKESLEKDPGKFLNGVVDLNGRRLKMTELAALAGRPFVTDPDTGAPIIPDASEGKPGPAFQELLSNARKRFVATNRRPPKPEEDQKLITDALEASKEKPPAAPKPEQPVKIDTKDPTTGRRITIFVPKSEAMAHGPYEAPPNAVTENRLSSADAVLQTGNDIIQKLSDPAYRATVGPLMGRYKTMREFVGNPPPEASELAGNIESYALASMGVHGMRSAQGAEKIKQLLDAHHTPESLIAAIRGLNNFSSNFMQTEGRPVPTINPALPAGKTRIRNLATGDTALGDEGLPIPRGWERVK